MASIQHRTRKDGTTAFDVVYRIDGRQSSLTFDDEKAAQAFRATVDAHGPVRALTMYGLDPEPRRRDNHRLTVADWLTHHINHLTGVEQYTIDKCLATTARAPGGGGTSSPAPPTKCQASRSSPGAAKLRHVRTGN